MTVQPNHSTRSSLEITETSERPAPQTRRPKEKEEAPQPKSPEEFYQQVTGRADVREFLKRLADL